MHAVFSSEQQAARHLLEESTAVLRKHHVDFVVVGGWPAYLFHLERYGHPGTFDVDILVNSGSLDDGTFDAASHEFLSRDYLRAPKNQFQAHRILNVSGEDLVFHIDFLNERDPGDSIELIAGTGKLKSIYTPIMRAVFDHEGYRTRPDIPGVRFPSPETYIATKAAAALVKKRNRDAFDIFVTAADQPACEFSARWKELVDRDVRFENANQLLLQALKDGDAIEKISAVLEQNIDVQSKARPSPSIEEIEKIFRFLVE